MTNLDFVNDMLSLIGVLPEGATASPEQGALALRVANELADEWADDGVSVNWSPASAIGDSCSLMGVELNAMKHQLAVRLCPYFGRDPSGTLIALASSAYTKLQRIQLVRSMEPVAVSLPISEGTLGQFDILTGTFR